MLVDTLFGSPDSTNLTIEIRLVNLGCPVFRHYQTSSMPWQRVLQARASGGVGLYASGLG